MHFIGMLAMDLSMSMSYNASLTVLSMVIAVGRHCLRSGSSAAINCACAVCCPARW
jgi:NO-binding membrane sensor protein with MHYT domain